MTASFAAHPSDLVLTIDDARDYARYGQVLTYIVTRDNQGTGAADAV